MIRFEREPPSSDMSSPSVTASMHAATASGPLARICFSISVADGISASEATTRLTSPMR